jgi:2-polyprenyl-3-methyl-5-hydroxy-6-metoxy-1,4-benzoquinol methylase
MIENRLEYQRMFEVEQKLWWYQTLHERVIGQIKKHFSGRATDVHLLDAAAGTGGLLHFLRDRGFRHLTGFDYSRHALEFSLERNLDVSFGDLRAVADFRPGRTFDVICCNDALYFLSDSEIVTTLKAFREKLNQNGLIIINIHAFEVFSGTHDLAIGSSRRFKIDDFERYARAARLKIRDHTYWPFTLSLPILAVRKWQKYQIKKGWVNSETTDSDVRYPGDFTNAVLRLIMKMERVLLRRAPFGSSLFLVMQAD